MYLKLYYSIFYTENSNKMIISVKLGKKQQIRYACKTLFGDHICGDEQEQPINSYNFIKIEFYPYSSYQAH
jgi:hypothetical protein